MTAIRDLADQITETAMRLQRRSRQETSVHGLTGGRLAALSRAVGEKRTSLTALAAAEGVSPATMARIVDWLEEGKLVLRTPSTEDGRSVSIVATMLGRSLAAGSRRRRTSWLETYISQLSAEERATLARAMALLEPVTER